MEPNGLNVASKIRLKGPSITLDKILEATKKQPRRYKTNFDRAVFEQTNEAEMGVVNSEFLRRSYGSFIRKKFIYIHLLSFGNFGCKKA